MISYWLDSNKIKDSVFIPKYYNPDIISELQSLQETHDCVSVRELVDSGKVSCWTGDEIGSNAYGTGDIPFVRTSDIANWEIKTAPKQGVSEEVYLEYAKSQDVQEGDILLVRDGTYLIGTNCFIGKLDQKLLFQSHIIKIRINPKKGLDPSLFFLALNSSIVQKQIRSFQFTADIIDTIGNRLYDLIIPIPKSQAIRKRLSGKVKSSLLSRARGRSFIRHFPAMAETLLKTGDTADMRAFSSLSETELLAIVRSDTISAELGDFECYWLESSKINEQIYLPKYYEPSIDRELNSLVKHCDMYTIKDLMQRGTISLNTGDEIGKMAYGTGTIPFIRTSDFSNWEIKFDPKQGVSQEIYDEYSKTQDMREGDILLVRDGTYLVGSSCIITKSDSQSLYCGGLYKFRINGNASLDPYLFLGLMNTYIVKRQMRTKQFTRDVIDTLGHRIQEVRLPIPKSKEIRQVISESVKNVVDSRGKAREAISSLAEQLIS